MALYDLYGLPVLSNIARSDSTHTQAVLLLLEASGLPDPAQGLAPAEFSDPTLQTLFDDHLARAQASLEEAVQTAALVEETDILDPQERLTQTTQADILRAYQNLLEASSNHLRAFARQLERRTGDTYAPELLDASQYDKLLSDARFVRGGPAMRGGRRRHPW